LNDNILERIDQALHRMENDGMGLDEYYYNLKAKREAIASGQPYCTYNITPYLIAYVASYIPDCNMGMNNKTIKGRGDKIKATIEAVTGITNYNRKVNYV
jgi:hypothetical protein